MKSRTAARAIASASRPTTRSLTPIIARYESTSAPASAGQASTSSNWQPVLPAGQNAAYDAALAFLDEHKTKSTARLNALRAQTPRTPEVESEIRHLEVSSLVNDPATRRLFRETAGKGLMDRPVMRHLAQRRWEREGGLDRLMQRVEQMGVVPDLVGGIRGSLPIRFSTSASASGEGEVEPGSIQPPSSFKSAPQLRAQLLDPAHEGQYTLLVVDPDSPNYAAQSFAERIHYFKSDIPLTVTSGEVDLFSSSAEGTEVLSWEPPLPPRGSGVHRYVFLLLRQPNAATTGAGPTERQSEITVRALVEEQGYTLSAVSLFRSKWTPGENTYIENTHREVHNGAEVPVFEKPPKELRYGMPLNKKSMEREQLREEAWNRALSDIVGEAGEIKVEKA